MKCKIITGKLTKEQLIKGLNIVLPKEEAEKEVNKLLNIIDVDGNGFIEYEEFLRAGLNKERIITKENLETSFKLYDIKKRGKINAKELGMVLRKGHEDLGENVWQEIIDEEKPIPIAIIWKPNVWKSTLLNFLVWKELAKVEDYLGTTRDYITWDFEYKWQKYRVYDTAWLRKKGSIHGIEKIAYDKIRWMLEYVRPCIIFMIDGAEWVTHRDMTLLAEINNLALPIMVAVNKMDLLDSKQKKQIQLSVQANLDYAKYIPIVPIVAKEWKWVNIMLDMLGDIISEAEKRIDTNELNKAINTEMIKRPPRFPKNKICKLYYITQIDINAPTFVAFINKKERANFAFKKWIENSIRNNFWFVWTPIVIRFKEKSRDSE